MQVAFSTIARQLKALGFELLLLLVFPKAYFRNVFIIFEQHIVEFFQYPLSYLCFVYPVACVCIIFLYVDILIVKSVVFCMKLIFS